MQLLKLRKKLFNDECGATAIEYGLIAAIVGIAIVIGAKSIGGGVNKLFAETENAIDFETTSQHSGGITLGTDRALTPLQTDETRAIESAAKRSGRVTEKGSSSADDFIDLDKPED